MNENNWIFQKVRGYNRMRDNCVGYYRQLHKDGHTHVDIRVDLQSNSLECMLKRRLLYWFCIRHPTKVLVYQEQVTDVLLTTDDLPSCHGHSQLGGPWESHL